MPINNPQANSENAKTVRVSIAKNPSDATAETVSLCGFLVNPNFLRGGHLHVRPLASSRAAPAATSSSEQVQSPKPLGRAGVRLDKNEGVVKRHFFPAMLCSTVWISERWRTEALKLSR
jgi:hypothetical protein